MDLKLNEAVKDVIIHSMSVGIAVFDINYNVIFFNDYFSNNFEVNTNKNLKPAFLNSEVKKYFNDAISKGKDTNFFWISDNLKFKTKPIMVNLKFINDGSSKFLLCIISENNDSNHWQREFNLLFEKVPSFICIVDRDLNVIRSNEKYRETFGDSHSIFTTDVARRKAVESSYSPSPIVFREGMEFIATQVGTTKNGSKCNLVVSSYPLVISEEGKVLLVMEIITDISELTLLQEQLNQAHDFYSELIENSADGIIAYDNKGRVQLFNSAARRILNWNHNRKPGLSKIIEMLPDDFLKDADINGSIINNKEYTIKDSEGRQIPVRLNAFELKNKKNSMGRAMIMQDLRLIKALEEEKKLAEKEAMVTTFVALEANTVKIFENENKWFDKFEKILFNAEKDEVEKAWNILRNKFKQHNNIISTFIKLSKGYTPNYSYFDFNELIAQINNIYNDIAESDKIDFNLTVVGEFGRMNSDRGMLDILLNILLSNSFEASLDNPGKPKVRVKIENKKSSFRIEVTDNGTYITPDKLERFFRVRDSKEARFGLLTVAILVRSCGGSINASSSLSDGNKFEVLLPYIP